MNTNGKAVGNYCKETYKRAKNTVYRLVELWVISEFVEERNDTH